MKKQVSIIGGSGFIGSYITKKFLTEGYAVKISVTDKSKVDKFQHISAMGDVDIEACDVRDFNAVKKFLDGTTNLVHTGTPFFFGVKDEQEEMLKPTIEGTKNVLKACQETPGLKKLVFVASIAAINGNIPFNFNHPEKGESHIFTEEDEPLHTKEHDPYCQAKYHADQTVRNFVRDHDNLNFEIVSLYPSCVVGAPLSNRQDSTSSHFLYAFKHKTVEDPSIKMFFDQNSEFAMVAVDDVAEAAYRSVVTSNLHGEKFIISNEAWRVSDIHHMLNGKPTQGTTRVQYNNQKAINGLKMEFRPAKEPLSEYAGL